MPIRRHTPRALEPLRRPAVPGPPLPSHAGLPSGGQALDRHTQARMSARFGHDLSSIRIHTDVRAGDAAAAAGANAFTVGGDIVFGAGQYQPGTRSGERLLAHELTHAVQQAQHGSGDPARASDRADASEREADALSGRVAAGETVKVSATPGAAIARDANDDSQRRLAELRANSMLAPWANMAMPGGAPAPEAAKSESSWKSFTDNPLWNIGTHDTVGAGMSLGVNKLDLVSEEAEAAALPRDINMQEFRTNHPELTPLGPESSGAARAAQQEGWNMNSVDEAAAREASSPVMQPLGRSAEAGEEALQSASRWKIPMMGQGALKFASRVASPFSAYSDYESMMKNWHDGEHADAVADGAGMVSGAIGSVDALAALGTWTGLASTGGALASAAEFLNPIGAVLGAGAGGFAGGKYALGKANTYAKNHELFGKGDDGEARDTTEAAADAGIAVKDKITDFDIGGYQLPGQKYLGDIAGGVTSVVGSWGTAGYSGIHALGGGIKDDAGWLWDHTFGDSGPSDEELAANQKKADDVMSQTLDDKINADEAQELYGSHSSVAHEEMPPLPSKEDRR